MQELQRDFTPLRMFSVMRIGSYTWKQANNRHITLYKLCDMQTWKLWSTEPQMRENRYKFKSYSYTTCVYKLTGWNIELKANAIRNGASHPTISVNQMGFRWIHQKQKPVVWYNSWTHHKESNVPARKNKFHY